jgi:uncharacterized membrane protein (DUF2068 family)
MAWWEHVETIVCGSRDHIVPGSKELPPEWAPLATETADGTRMARCIRCDAWLVVPPPTERLEELTPAHVPRRGKELRDAVILRLIAIDRALHSVLFGVAAIGLFVLRLDLGGLQASARHLINGASNTLAGPGQTASRDSLQRLLDRILQLRPRTLGTLAVTAAIYCAVEGTEAVGLWLEKRWAEYLTAVATAGFLPFEVDALIHKFTVFKVVALAVNLAVLVYLVWRKHLFGIGGRPEHEDRVAALRATLDTVAR